MLTRRASLGRYDADAVQALLDRDPDPESEVRALGVTAARPAEEAKREAWEQVFERARRTRPARRSSSWPTASGARSSTS